MFFKGARRYAAITHLFDEGSRALPESLRKEFIAQWTKLYNFYDAQQETKHLVKELVAKYGIQSSVHFTMLFLVQQVCEAKEAGVSDYETETMLSSAHVLLGVVKELNKDPEIEQLRYEIAVQYANLMKSP